MLIDPPIGNEAERTTVWPSTWFDANPFLNWYQISPGVWNYHTGADLNNNSPTWNADYHSPIYAIADGNVIFAGVGGGSWGHIIVIQHRDDHGHYFYSRVGHIEKPIVSTDNHVVRGQQIANVGNGDGVYAGGGEHLHFDICTTDLLLTKPNHWPGTNKAELIANYTDPKAFIVRMRIEAPLKTVNLALSNKINLYAGPGLSYAVQHGFPAGVPIDVDDQNAVFDTATGLTFYPTPVDGWVEASCVGLPELTGAPVTPPPPVYRYVNTPGDVLNLRATGDKSGAILAKLPHQTQVQLLVAVNTNGYDMVSVTLNGTTTTGYAADAYLVTTRP